MAQAHFSSAAGRPCRWPTQDEDCARFSRSKTTACDPFPLSGHAIRECHLAARLCHNRAANRTRWRIPPSDRRDHPAGIAGATGAAGADPARDFVHDRRDGGVRGLERGVKMAGGDLSGRRGAVHAHARLADRAGGVRAAAHRACGVSHAAARPACDAVAFAELLAVVPADCVQPDAARGRGGDQLLGSAVHHAGVDPAAAWNASAGRAGRRCWSASSAC